MYEGSSLQATLSRLTQQVCISFATSASLLGVIWSSSGLCGALTFFLSSTNQHFYMNNTSTDCVLCEGSLVYHLIFTLIFKDLFSFFQLTLLALQCAVSVQCHSSFQQQISEKYAVCPAPNGKNS